MATLKRKISSTLEHICKNHRANAKLKAILDADQISALSMSILKGEKTQDMITDLQVLNSCPLKFITCSSDMAELAASYHNKLQLNDEHPTSRREALQEILASIQPNRLSDEEGAELNTPMDESYLTRALKASANGVATSLNGHLTKFYKCIAKEKGGNKPT